MIIQSYKCLYRVKMRVSICVNDREYPILCKKLKAICYL